MNRTAPCANNTTLQCITVLHKRRPSVKSATPYTSVQPYVNITIAVPVDHYRALTYTPGVNKIQP